MAPPRERPDRIASTIFVVLAGVCAVTGLILTATVERHAELVVIATLFQTLLFAALALVAHDVEDIKAIVRSLPAADPATSQDDPTDPRWTETWRVHDRSEERD